MTIADIPVADTSAADTLLAAAHLERWLTWGFFIALALVGLFLHRDYGISWDEPWQARHGGVLWRFIFEDDDGLLKDRARYHGTIVPFLWMLMERFDYFADSQRAYYFRHLGNFALFYIGIVGFYLLCRRGLGSWTWALLGALMLVLSPRLFGHAFFNPKDIPFMSLFIWAIFTCVWMLERPSWTATLAHALVCVVLINFRILGVLVPALSIGFLLARYVFMPDTRAPWSRTLAMFAVYFLILFVGVVSLWPTLWDQPVQQLLNAFNHIARFPWRGDVLYLGEYHQSDRLPWHYPFVWMAVTIPIIYLALFPLGLFGFLRQLVADPKSFQNYWLDLLICAWMVTPVAAVLILDSVLYDGWRHLYFLYPAMLWFALKGARIIWMWLSRSASIKFRPAWVAVFAFTLLANVASIVAYHPYQGVYFNRLAGIGDQLRHRFELDYWGVSYRDGLNHILRTDPRERITVLAANLPGEWNSLILSDFDRRRLQFVFKARDADYFITNYRWHPGDYDFEPPIYSISAGGTRIMGVYAFRPPVEGSG